MTRRVWSRGVAHAVVLATLLTTGLVATSAGAAAGAPSVPRTVRASGTATSVTVKWSKPTTTGATPIRGYVVTSRPKLRSCTSPTTSCVVKGLTPGSSYTFSVVAKNDNGWSAPSVSNRIRVAKTGTYFSARFNVFKGTSSEADTALASALTKQKEKKAVKALKALKASFSTFIASLELERWPTVASGNMERLIADTRVLAADTVAPFEATPSNEADNYDVLQRATTKELLIAADVYTNLGYASPIISSIAAAPSPVSLNTIQTIHDLYGNAVSVTATQIFDPATGTSGSGLPSGYRFVAVEASLSNPSSITVYGDANYSMTVTGSDGQTYAADFDTVSQCTNFESGDFELSPGSTSAGCVSFELPTSVTVKSIQFTLAPGYLDTAEWNS